MQSLLAWLVGALFCIMPMLQLHAQELNYIESDTYVEGGLSRESGARLMDPVMGDFNGDGISDLAWGAPGFGQAERTEAGAVYVLLGSSTRDWSKNIDSTLLSSFDYRFDGAKNRGLLGLTLAFADLNGDGKDDLVMAEPGNTGSVYVVLGGKSLERGTYDVADPKVSDLKYYTSMPSSLLGAKLCTGDFNNDGLQDLALASLSLDEKGNVLSTDVTIINSRRQWPQRVYNIYDKSFARTRLMRPMSNNISALYQCAAGDFNDDHLTDIALGLDVESYQRQDGAGAVFIVYNPTKYSGSSLNLLQKDPAWGVQLYGDQAEARLGQSLASGDFTGDGKTDLLISEPGRLIRGPQSEGRVILLEGGKFPQNSGYLQDGYFVTGSGQSFGTRLQALDINADARPDIVVGQPEENSIAGARGGKVTVYFGGPHLLEALAAKRQPDIILGGQEFSRLGFGSAVGDLNGDSKRDWVIRAGEDPLQRPATGSLVIVENASTLELQSTISEKNTLILGPSQGGGLSSAPKVVRINNVVYTAWLSSKGLGNRSVLCLVAKENKQNPTLSQPESCDLGFVGPENTVIKSFDFGDFNGDGSSDLVIGMPEYTWDKGSGVVAVLSLPAEMNKVLALNFDWQELKKSAWTFVLNDEYDTAFGQKVELKDLDADDIPELVIGASRRVVAGERSGSVFIVKGDKERKRSVSNLAISKQKQLLGSSNEEFGSDWATLDFNLDGTLDLVVLGEKYTNSRRENYARAYVIYSPGQLSEKAHSVNAPNMGALCINAPKPAAGLKIISASEDLSSDNAPDLALLSPHFRSGLLRSGIIYVLHAKPERAAGMLKLENESLVDFTLKPNRNDRIIDANFALIAGQTHLFLATQSMLDTSLATTAYAISVPQTATWHGSFNFYNIAAQKLQLSSHDYLQFIVLNRHELGQAEDAVWVLHPEAGTLQSGTGIARRLSTQSKP